MWSYFFSSPSNNSEEKDQLQQASDVPVDSAPSISQTTILNDFVICEESVSLGSVAAEQDVTESLNQIETNSQIEEAPIEEEIPRVYSECEESSSLYQTSELPPYESNEFASSVLGSPQVEESVEYSDNYLNNSSYYEENPDEYYYDEEEEPSDHLCTKPAYEVYKYVENDYDESDSDSDSDSCSASDSGDSSEYSDSEEQSVEDSDDHSEPQHRGYELLPSYEEEPPETEQSMCSSMAYTDYISHSEYIEDASSNDDDNNDDDESQNEFNNSTAENPNTIINESDFFSEWQSPQDRSESPSANWSYLDDSSVLESFTHNSQLGMSRLPEPSDQSKDQQIESLKAECQFLYDIILKQQELIENKQFDELEQVDIHQTCQRCNSNFIANSDWACRYHTGELKPTKFSDNIALIPAYEPTRVSMLSPERHWGWSCCNNTGPSAPGCTFGRHIPVQYMEASVCKSESSEVPKHPYFHPTNSLVLYDSITL